MHSIPTGRRYYPWKTAAFIRHPAFSGIPKRFITGLRDAEALLAHSRRVARQAVEPSTLQLR
jgi:hypothetical protein